MDTTHLTQWDQEEYVLGQRTPAIVHHLERCSDCQAAVARLEQGVQLFRQSATQWSAECIENRPERHFRSMPAAAAHHEFRWALAVLLIVLCLLPLYFLRTHTAKPEKQLGSTAASTTITDDALLQGVDDEVSFAVPSSMEPLTHLVTTSITRTGTGSSARGGTRNVQSN